MSPCLAASRADATFELVETSRLPRHAFDLVIAFAFRALDGDRLADLVSLRNALTPAGSLLVVLGPGDAAGDLEDLASQAGFTRIREIANPAPSFATIELKR